MASSGTLGIGSILGYSDDGVTFTSIVQTKSIKGPGFKIDSKEITNNDSPNATREFIPGLIDPGELSCSGVYKSNVVTAVLSLLRVVKYWRVTSPDGHYFQSQGFITSFEEDESAEEPNTYELAIKLTGLPLFV